MKKRKKIKKYSSTSWLPIDSRILPHIFAFGRVKGIARIFLEIEMIIATLVVLGTGLVVLLKPL